VKLLALCIGALVLLIQIVTMQAQETLDVAKITCRQLMMEQLASPSRDVVLWLSGYYNGRRNNTIIDIQTIKKDVEKVNTYCYHNSETTVLDAIKNVLGLDK
jgi:hypothetical protein